MSVRIVVTHILLTCCGLAWAQTSPKKVALLAGVNQYQKRGFKNLAYAERDVTELEKELKKLGFKTVLLTGQAEGALKATRKNINDQLLKLLSDTGKEDIVLVALSGHGQQLMVPTADGGTKDDGFYCPYDAELGNPATQFSLSYLTDEILAKKGGRNLVLIDACRDKPKDPGRGGKGVQGKIVSLPEDTAIFFSCRTDQQSWENDELQHGVFTYCLLEGLRGQAAKGNEIAWSGLINHVEEQMASPAMKKYLVKTQEPISAGGVGRTVLGNIFVGGFAGEGRELVKGIRFRWCPAGSFTMGSPTSELGDAGKHRESENQVQVTLSSGFWLGETEVTQGQWELLMGSAPWKGNDYVNVKEGADYAANYISHGDDGDGKLEADSATDFCLRLTERERKGGRLSAGWKYALPTESQWEYGCRAGTKTAYVFGDDKSKLSDYAWWGGQLGDGNAKTELYAHRVGLKQSNAWGLHDMHGNVYEWCADWYDEKLPGGRDPVGAATGLYRVYRGGSWVYPASLCRSADRVSNLPTRRFDDLGFRVAGVPSSE